MAIQNNAKKIDEKHYEKGEKIELRISGSSVVEKVASAMVRFVKDGLIVSLSMIGANAVNQAVKAVIKANSFSAPSGFTLSISPFFDSEEVQGQEKSIIKMNITKNAIHSN